MAVGGPAPHDAAENAGHSPERDSEDSPEPDAGHSPEQDTEDSPERDAGHPPEPASHAPAIRPFLLTAGRVSGDGTTPPLSPETQLVSTSAGLLVLPTLAFEQHDIIAACRQPQSVAELAAHLRLHLNVVRVLAEDLYAAGHLAVHRPSAGTVQDLSVLRRVIDGLRAVPESPDALRDSN